MSTRHAVSDTPGRQPARWLTVAGLHTGLVLSLLCLITLLPSSVDAAIYKCVSADGDTTYTSAPCPHDESTQRISRRATAVAGLDCRIAHHLALDTARRMVGGESSSSLLDSHGGIDSVSPLVIGMISYIYTFQGNERVQASRIASLATERCRVGAYGSATNDCNRYPREFIHQLGGCSAARAETPAGDLLTSDDEGLSTQGHGTLPAIGAARPDSSTRYTVPSAAAPVNDQAASWAAAVESVNARNACKQRIGDTLSETGNRLELAESTQEQLQLQALQRQLRLQIARC